MKNKRRALSLTLSVFFLVVLAFPLFSQVRGKELYELLSKNRALISFEGISRIDWTPDGKAYYLYKDKTFQRIDAATGESSPLLDDEKIIAAFNRLSGKNLTVLPFNNFDFLEGGQKICFSFSHRAYIYDLSTGQMLFYFPQGEYGGVRGRMYSEVLSPDLTKRAYIEDYNLYVKDLNENEKALTTDGHKDLRNGYPDWVYPEELSQYEAFWWSPDSQKIAYMQFDENPVKLYPLVHDISPVPELEMQRYPKAGANNPIVRLFIVDVKTRKTVQLETGLDTNVYLFRGQWTPDGKIFTYQRMNRLQNLIELWAADPTTGKTRLIIADEDPCYVEADFDLTFLKDSDRFLWTSEKSGWNEIYLYDLSGMLIKQLTDAKLPVMRIEAVDEANGWVYFTGLENRGLESHLYRVKLDGTGFTRLTKEPGSHRINLSPEALFYTDTFSSFEKPRRVALHTADGTFVRELGNSTVTQKFKDLELIPPEHFTFKSADNKFDLDAVLYKPAHFDKNEKYPLIMTVYGGPGAKMIHNRYLMNDRNQALAQLGFIVLAIDHRGVSGRGKNFQNLMYMNLGQIELEDHVAAAKHVGNLPYVDETRVGITGGSYGGYMTCIALLKEPDVFHVGVAGAPVTDWRNYDSIYTERYMRRPQDNPEGYKEGSCLIYARNLKGHLFINHGAVDNNVHPGNTVQLVQELLKLNKKFDLMIYPEQRHGIRFLRYGEARIEYFIEHLKPDIHE
ncbi:MAG: S9 family peptidase [Candidatus Aminicenantes bacterium]|nr:S9 family peptidase [Candidatus Aminicenantes bacterium]